MQIAPSELRTMSLWEFSAIAKGWSKAQGPSKPEELSIQVQDELGEFIDEPPPWVQ